MNVLFIARATLYSGYGGDTVQIVSTAKYLRRLGASVDIKLSGEQINYDNYDLLHFFNIIRPADIMTHIEKSKLPYVVSTIFLDLSASQKAGKGLRAFFSKYFSADQMEYLKAIARWLKNGEVIQSRRYIYQGHKTSIRQIAMGAAYLLPNSESEYKRFAVRYKVHRPYKVIYNGIDKEIFGTATIDAAFHDPLQVLCVARFESNKNQMNLIKALNNTPYKLRLIGKPAPNHLSYYDACKKIAADNVTFETFVATEQLIKEYQSAKVHVLASWNETCGLSSLEAAYNNCNIVITDKGDTVEYFGENAWYCDPADSSSIYKAVVAASKAPVSGKLKKNIETKYTWQQAASDTYTVYRKILGEDESKNDQEIESRIIGKDAEKIKVTT